MFSLCFFAQVSSGGVATMASLSEHKELSLEIRLKEAEEKSAEREGLLQELSAMHEQDGSSRARVIFC
jgi:hypothetical protein